ncbi:MAG TPA: cupredoxin domain-containing protein [Vicinamibacterales bacterium]
MLLLAGLTGAVTLPARTPDLGRSRTDVGPRTSDSGRSGAQDAPAERQFAVSAHKYGFEPSRIEVAQGDLVRVTLTTKDIPHSFTIDAYRLAKRVSPGGSVTFEFRADQAGTFPYYCNLVIDEGCRNMKGQLVVKPAR